MAWSLEVESELRPCEVYLRKDGIRKGLFHCWSHNSKVATGGTVAYSTGIVELEDGKH